MAEVMKIMGTAFKRCHACTAPLGTLNPAAAHCQPTPPPETPGHPQASLGPSLMGSLLLSPGFWWAQGFVCALQAVDCLFSGSMVGLICPVSQVCYRQSPCPHDRSLLTRAAAGGTQTLKGRSLSVSSGIPVSWCTQGFV